MEESWKRFTFIGRKLTQLRNAAFPSPPVSPAAPVPSPSPAPRAEISYIPVSKADAIAKLCEPTGDELLDEIHIVLIDLLQRDYIYAVCTATDPALRYSATDAGKKYVEENLQQAVDDLLGRIFDD